MPPVIPFIVAIGAVEAFTIGGIVVTVGEIAGFVASIGASFALSAVSRAITGKPKQASIGAFQDRTQAVRQPITARRVIYGGPVRVSGVYTFIHSTDSNQYINLLLTLSGHQIQSIDSVYFDDELIPLDSTGNATGKYAGYVIIKKGLGSTAGDADLLSAMMAYCPGVWTSNHRQSGCGKLYVRLKYSATLFPNGIPNISCIVKGKLLLDPRTGLIEWSNNAALCVRNYLKDSTYGLGEANVNDTVASASANVCDEVVGTLTRVGDFTVYQIPAPTAAPIAKQNLISVPSGTPAAGVYKYAFTFVDASGETVPGPLTTYSQNAAIWGVALSGISKGPTGTTARKIYRTVAGGSQLKLLATLSDNTTAEYADATADGSLGANAPTSSTTAVYDDIRVTGSNIVLSTGEAVALTTTGTLPAGLSATTYYVIDTGNHSYYLATSKANALAGTHVDITGLGSGTHTLNSASEVRYTCNGTFDTDEKPKDVIGKLLTSMQGKVTYQGGEWIILPGAYRNPTITLDENDLDGPIKVTSRISRSQTFNAVKGVYINPLDFYQPNDFPPITNATYLAEDQGERIWKDIELPFTTSGSMAQRIAKIELEKARQQITTTWPCKLTAFRVQAGDVVNLSNTRWGWSSKPFEVTNWKFSIRDDNGTPRLGIDLVLRETASGVYDWNSGEETAIDLAPNTTLPDPFTVQVPGNPSVTEELYQTTGSAGVKSKAIVSWGASADGFADNYQLEYKPATQANWLVRTGIKGFETELIDLAPGYYDFRLKAFNSIGVDSDYTNEVRVNIMGLSAPPAAVSNFSVIASNGYALASWALSPDLDVQINGSIIIRHSSKTSSAVWEDGIILEEFPGGAVQGIVALITGTYMAKAKDSTGNYSTSMTPFVATEGMTTGFTTVATSTQAPGFTGTKTNVTVAGSVLRLTDPSVSTTGSYAFSAYLDMTTVKTRRLESDIDALSYVATDLIDSMGEVDSWASVDGDSVDGCDLTLYMATTNDDPAGTPVWSAWTPFRVADVTCRAVKFRLDFISDSETNNIDVSVLTVHVKEAV
jgi:hypothetical protein